MSDFIIYHNPRCSKSRATLELLRERGVEPHVRLYLEETLDARELARLLEKLGMSAAQLVRRGEAEYKALGLDKHSGDAELTAAMVQHPRLIERPIVVSGDRAVLGRPPENVLELLD